MQSRSNASRTLSTKIAKAIKRSMRSETSLYIYTDNVGFIDDEK